MQSADYLETCRGGMEKEDHRSVVGPEQVPDHMQGKDRSSTGAIWAWRAPCTSVQTKLLSSRFIPGKGLSSGDKAPETRLHPPGLRNEKAPTFVTVDSYFLRDREL